MPARTVVDGIACCSDSPMVVDVVARILAIACSGVGSLVASIVDDFMAAKLEPS